MQTMDNSQNDCCEQKSVLLIRNNSSSAHSHFSLLAILVWVHMQSRWQCNIIPMMLHCHLLEILKSLSNRLPFIKKNKLKDSALLFATCFRQLSIRILTTVSVPGNRRILQGLKSLFTWAWMCFTLTKSKPLVLKRGKAADQLEVSRSHHFHKNP